MSTELGLSKEQASQIETEVLGMPKELFYDSRPTPPVDPPPVDPPTVDPPTVDPPGNDRWSKIFGYSFIFFLIWAVKNGCGGKPEKTPEGGVMPSLVDPPRKAPFR